MLALALALAAPALGQSLSLQPFLIINQERLLTGSRTGQALLEEEGKRRDALSREARALDAAFEAEERELTEKRPTLPAEEFRALSDAFDERVVKARRDQDARASQLAQEFDQSRRAFYSRVAPILVALMDRAGAKAVFDENSVLLADQSLNITDAVIAEIDSVPADGQGTEPTTEPTIQPGTEPGPSGTAPATNDMTPPPVSGTLAPSATEGPLGPAPRAPLFGIVPPPPRAPSGEPGTEGGE